MKVDLPIFSLIMGYRPSGLGVGLWKSPCQRSSAAIATTTSYGPLGIGFGTYLGRTATNWNQFPRDSGTSATYRRDDDRNYLGGVYGDLKYSCGALVVELSSTAFKDISSQPVDARDYDTGVPGNLTQVVTPRPDKLHYDLTLAMKYMGDRFFFNAEVDRFMHFRSGVGTTVVRAGRRIQGLDTDASSWLYGVETGVLLGRGIITLSYARSTGDDPATRKDDEDSARATTGLNNCVMRNWAFLMYHMYGSGTGWNASGEGQPVNLHHVGARLDCSAAANLKVCIVYSRAWRDQTNAFVLGGDYSHTVAAFTNNTIARQQGLAGFDPPVPGLRAVPDHANEVGWEVDLGFDWKLLENFTLRHVFAFWKPGNWWSYAYPNTVAIYRRNGGTVPQAPTDSVGALTDAGRDINPLFAFQTEFRTEF